MRAERANEPDSFFDLNLDQVVDGIVAKHDKVFLRPIFYSQYRNEEIVRYRQSVFADLDRPEVFSIFPDFCNGMRMIRAELGYAEKIAYPKAIGAW